jgi:hypothetical protein
MVVVMSERVMSERVMSEHSPEPIHDQIRELLDSLYRVDSGRILATLIRLLGDFDLAEEWSTRQPATMADFDGPIQSH